MSPRRPHPVLRLLASICVAAALGSSDARAQESDEAGAAAEPEPTGQLAADDAVEDSEAVAARPAPELEVLFPPNPMERVASVEACDDVDLLLWVLRHDPAPEVRASAARGLSSHRSERVHEALDEALAAEPDRRVRQVILEVRDQTEPARPGSSLLRVGLSLFLAAYVPTALAGLLELIIGAVDDDSEVLTMGWQLMVPVVGPPLAVMLNEPDADRLMALAWISGLMQASSVVVALIGAFRRVRARRQIELTPTPAGVSVRGWFG